MNILIVSQYFWPEQFLINDLVLKLHEQGHSVSVFTGKPNYPDGVIYPGYQEPGVHEEVYANAIPVYRVPLRPRKSGGKNLALNYLSFIFSGLKHAFKFSKNKQFDVLFVFAISPITAAIPAIMLKWLTKAHLALWVQDLWPESVKATGFIHNRFILNCIALLVRGIYYFSDTILAQSKAFIPPITRLTNANKVIYYPNSVKDDFLYQVHNQGLPDDLVTLLETHFCVVFASNIGTAQSVETIVLAAEQLKKNPAIKLIMVGSGSKMDWVAEQIDKKKLGNLILTGRYPSSCMPFLFYKASALLVTLKKREIFSYTIPSKIQSYLAAARPIIAAIDGEGARIIEQANAGVTCPAEDSDGLVKCIEAIYAMSLAEREQMGLCGRDYFLEHFNMPSQVIRLIDIFNKRINAHVN